MIVLYVLGYFNRNKQNSYAALNNVAASQEIPSRLKLIETCKFEYNLHKGGGLCQN